MRRAATWPPDDEQELVSRVVPTAGGECLFERTPPTSTGVEVRHHGELLVLLPVRMPPSEPLDPMKEALVSDLAAQAGLCCATCG